MADALSIHQQALAMAQGFGNVRSAFKVALSWGRSITSVDDVYKDRVLTLHGIFRRHRNEIAVSGTFEDLSNLLSSHLDLAEDLIRVWPNVKANGNRHLIVTYWYYQWNKHGKWFGLTMEQFFRMAVFIYDSLPLAEIGIKSGIPYTLKKLQNRILLAISVYGNVKGKAGVNEYERGIAPKVTDPKVHVFLELILSFSAAVEYMNAPNHFSGSINSNSDVVMFL